MNIAIVDYARIAPDADFPLLETERDYRWTQFPLLDAAGVREDCWRAHILVTRGTTIDADTIAALPMLQYVVIAGDDIGLVDLPAAQARGIKVGRISGGGSPAELCRRIVDALDAIIAGQMPGQLI